MKRILMIATGGTIASKSSETGLKPLITSDELLRYVPDTREFCQADTLQLINIDSTNMQPCHWLKIAAAIREHYDAYDGFVVCHGTDTMAYTAAALSYLIQNSPKPIVITGAQKPIDLEITDAKTNLTDSLRFASHDKAYGVVIVFDGKVIAGTRGKKERTKSYNAFSSINFPYIATIQEPHVIFYLDDKALLKAPVRFYDSLNPRIALLKLIPSMEAGVLSYLADHYDAVIIESFGVGGLPSYESGDFHKAIQQWTHAGKTVVMTTQVTNEGSNMSIYEVGKTIKQEFGLLEAYDMTLEATVTKLMWILGQTGEPKQIRDMFYRTINRDILYTACNNPGTSY
ncbi:MAG: asparaginase [Lachnospiraceae bacterium]|nr:asparaginase [Lachnospiraceae bacterium]